MRHLAERPRLEASGGQQQRVALARAIAFSPTVVLFDEPLSNLDAKLRAEMRVELRELQRRLDITSVYVTHDQEEALAISDRVIVMNVGRDRADRHARADLQSAEEPLRRRFRRLRQPHQGPRARGRAPARSIRGRGRHDAAGDGASRGARRRDGGGGAHGLYRDRRRMPGANQMPGTVRRRMFHGDFVQYVVDCPLGQMIVRRPPTNLVDEGDEMSLSFSPEHCVLLEG